MKKILLAIPAFVMLMLACKGNKATALPDGDVQPDSVADTTDTVPQDTMELLITETKMPQAADELFDDFIFNFTANRKLQRERIVFPLPLWQGESRSELAASQWSMDHFFMRQGFYTLMFDSREQMERVRDTSVSKAIVERIYLDENRVRQYLFSRIRGVWMLRELKDVTIEEHPEASFLTFYKDFVSDTAFQFRSLNETVQFVGPDPDDDFSQMEGVITDETWPAFAPDMPSGMIYNIVYGEAPVPGDTKIFVIRGIANGFEIEMTFQRKGGRWLLMKLMT